MEWVKEFDADVCVWCEAQSIYRSGTADRMPEADRYLVGNWGELAVRYGHKYWYVGGHRDNFPQVITSKYPIENVERIVGEEPDSVVTHGRDAHEGDRYRRMEIEYICRHTIGTAPRAAEELWVMLGDNNSWSRLDNWFYKCPEDDPRLLTQDYVLEHTPYVDVIARQHPGRFQTTTHSEKRIDFVYCTPVLYDCVTRAEVVRDDYTEPVRDPKKLSNFWHPSDHRPIVVDFDLKKAKKQ